MDEAHAVDEPAVWKVPDQAKVATNSSFVLLIYSSSDSVWVSCVVASTGTELSGQIHTHNNNKSSGWRSSGGCRIRRRAARRFALVLPLFTYLAAAACVECVVRRRKCNKHCHRLPQQQPDPHTLHISLLTSPHSPVGSLALPSSTDSWL